MGRWSFVTLRRKKQKPVTIVTVYQVNIRPTNDIGITAWHQQRLELNKQGNTKLHPRQAFIQDLIKLVEQFQYLNHDIIIGGDFNETSEKHNSGLLKLMTTTGLLDIWTHRFPTHPTFNTYKRGTNRIDTVLCSPNIVPMINGIGYSPFNWFTNSDHRAIVLEISSTTLFQEPDDISNFSVQQRAIRSNDIKRTHQYINQCYKHLIENNATKFLSQTETFTATTKEIETFDNLITQASLSAEKSCRRRRPEFYSNKINSLRIRTSIAHGYFNQLKKYNQCNTNGFQARLQRAGTTIGFKKDPQEAYQVYKNLRHELQEVSKQSRDERETKLASRIHEKYEAGSPEYIQRLKNIKKGEATKRAWQSMKFMRTQTGATQSLNRIDIPKSWPLPTSENLQSHPIEDPAHCTEWKTVTNPDHIESYIRLRNRGHFGQAQGTPFTELPLRDDINWQADSITSDDILNGHHQIDSIQSIPQCQVLLDTCKVATELDLIPYYIWEKDFEKKNKSLAGNHNQISFRKTPWPL